MFDEFPGGVTIAWVGDGSDQQPQIFMLQPFLAKDFAIRSLPDHIADLQQLVTLYPDTPKEKAFGKYFTAFPSELKDFSFAFYIYCSGILVNSQRENYKD